MRRLRPAGRDLDGPILIITRGRRDAVRHGPRVQWSLTVELAPDIRRAHRRASGGPATAVRQMARFESSGLTVSTRNFKNTGARTVFGKGE